MSTSGCRTPSPLAAFRVLLTLLAYAATARREPIRAGFAPRTPVYAGLMPHSTRLVQVSRADGPSNLQRAPVKFQESARWQLQRDGLEVVPLPVRGAAELALQAGVDMCLIASRWKAIKNGDRSTGRRQSYLRMRKTPPAPLSETTASVLGAAERLVKRILGSKMELHDSVVIADFEADLPRQELHRDIRRSTVDYTTHGLLVPLAQGARLHVVPGSHKNRSGNLRGVFKRDEVVTLEVPPGHALLWDGMLVHAGDSAALGTVPGRPNRPRLHAYPEVADEDRPFDDKGDREIEEVD